jgi:hypothetical protein
MLASSHLARLERLEVHHSVSVYRLKVHLCVRVRMSVYV